MFNKFPPRKNRAVYKIMWENMVQPDRPQWRYNAAYALCMVAN